MLNSPSTTRAAARTARAAVTVWWLTVQTASDTAWGARYEWSQRHAHRGALLRRLVALCRYQLAGMVDRRAFARTTGWVPLAGNLDHSSVRRQRRLLADIRRRHALVLLRSLGTNTDDVEASLTRYWQLTAPDDWMIPLVPDFLAARLRWRDPIAPNEIDILPWASNIGGVWVATPAPVRRYLSRADDHERRLSAAYRRHPRHGVRPAPRRA
ncbi:hypothetical protein [Rugosimonospora africana]|uniref:Uncharacterized protein n=1 Tax=Rugosimonospora africana TaxID=556532 RepID=A0A8J3VRF5_9ACTN|nr:hypothetical protein [Rugosimonospora africana]GIH16135.1 hypothetical protein Raf01_43070 [Rugosimonospora africana]